MLWESETLLSDLERVVAEWHKLGNWPLVTFYETLVHGLEYIGERYQMAWGIVEHLEGV